MKWRLVISCHIIYSLLEKFWNIPGCVHLEHNEREATEAPASSCDRASAQFTANLTPFFTTTHHTRTHSPTVEQHHTHYPTWTTPFPIRQTSEPSRFASRRQHHVSGMWCPSDASQQLLSARIGIWKWWANLSFVLFCLMGWIGGGVCL